MRLSSSLIILSLTCLRLTAQNDTWTVFSPPPPVSSLAARGDALFAGTNGGGIVRFDTLGNRTHFNTGNSALPSDSIALLAVDAAGNWWMQHPGSISRFDGATAQTWTLTQTGLPANAAVRALKAAPDSSVYVATDNGVAVFKNGAWTVLNTGNSGLPTNNVWDVAFGPDGKRYFATNAKGVVVQDGAWTGYTAVSIGLGTPAPLLRKVAAGNAGRLILTTTRTVSILQQGAWTHHFTQDIGCIPEGTITPAEDGAGRIWIPTRCELARLDGQAWSQHATGLPGTPAGIMYDGIAEGADGSIWLGAEGGRYITRLTTADTWEQYFPTDHGASNNDVYSVQADPGGAIWFGLDSAQILRYSNGAWTLFDTCATHFPGHFVVTSAGAPNGDRWFAFHRTSPIVSSGLARLGADGQWQFFTLANSPIPLSYIRTILIDANGTAWFSTGYNGNKGIFRYNGATWDSLTVSNSGLPSNRVGSMAQAPDGAVWAATDIGLARYDGQNWTVLTSANSGLPATFVLRVAFDQAGGMYVGYAPETPNTPGARVAELRGGVWTELLPPNWGQFGGIDEPDAFFADSQNRLWFAKSVDYFGRVYRYDPMLVRAEEPATAQPLFDAAPNPTAGPLTLQLNAPLRGEARLHVWNTFGQCVFQRVIPQTTETTVPLDLSALPAGVYWVQLRENGSLGATVRVVKQ